MSGLEFRVTLVCVAPMSMRVTAKTEEEALQKARELCSVDRVVNAIPWQSTPVSVAAWDVCARCGKVLRNPCDRMPLRETLVSRSGSTLDVVACLDCFSGEHAGVPDGVLGVDWGLWSTNRRLADEWDTSHGSRE